MSPIKVSIKNSGKLYPLELQLEETGLQFKEKIKDLTNIPIERQKILLKGGQLTNDKIVKDLNLKEGQIIMVLGSPELVIPTAPSKNEKLNDDEDVEDEIEVFPTGLNNLGNTCYLNSTVQTLFSIQLLKDYVLKNEKFGEIGTNHHLILQMKSVFKELEAKKQESISPTGLITSLRYLYPQFNERDNHGRFKQQDAEEVFTQLLLSLKSVLGEEFIQNFEIKFKSKITNKEDLTDEEIKFDEDLKLQCHISNSTNFLKNGLIESLNEVITKRSENLNKDCDYEINKSIVKLPKILTVQFVRFFWKRSTNKKSKILRKVQFPFQLDLTDLLDEDYKEEKIKIRDELRSIEKEEIQQDRDFKKRKVIPSINEEIKFKKENYEKYLNKYKEIFPKNLSTGENPSSLYTLQAVVTHQGSSADSGHYQAFVKDKYDDNKWWRFNDDKVSIVEKDRVENLAGGGESDSALILIYKGFGLD